MTRPAPDNERFLSRWSRLKRAQKESAESAGAPATHSSATDPGSASVSARASIPATDPASASVSAPAGGSPAVDADASVALPPIESLTMESDYAQFFQPKVPEALRRAAVKKLFADPHFNIMDGLDTYIDDYSKPDPLPAGMLAKLWHARDIIDHPSNRKPEAEESEAMSAVAGGEAASPVMGDDTIPAEPARRPREGGDPATADSIEGTDPAIPSESLWVPACAGTTRSNDCGGTAQAPVANASDKPAGTTA